jgi:hypothetical protein
MRDRGKGISDGKMQRDVNNFWVCLKKREDTGNLEIKH